jgi:hypothetical protein
MPRGFACALLAQAIADRIEFVEVAKYPGSGLHAGVQRARRIDQGNAPANQIRAYSLLKNNPVHRARAVPRIFVAFTLENVVPLVAGRGT